MGGGPEELSHVQWRLASFHRQLVGYMNDFSAILQLRNEQQAKRDRFLSLVRDIVKTQQDISMGMVDLFQEREMSLERNRKLQHLKTIQVQNQRRIKELLIRTDPSRTKEEIKAAAQQLDREAQVESVSLTLEALLEQRRGYRDLALEYVKGLQEDSKHRDEEITWCTDFCTGTLADFQALAKQSEARQQTIMERYLVRRHNARLLKQGLDALRESCRAAKKKVEAEGQVLKERQALEIRLLNKAAEREVEGRLESLRRQVRARENDLRDLREWYTRVQEEYNARVSGLTKELKTERAKTKRLRKVRGAAHAHFALAIREVRDRLNEFQRDRCMQKADFQDMRDLLEALHHMQRQEDSLNVC